MQNFSSTLTCVWGLLDLGFNLGQGGVEKPTTPLCYVSGCCQLCRRNSGTAMILSSSMHECNQIVKVDVSVLLCFRLKPHAQKAPADGLALLRWTLHAVDRYFTTIGTRRLWLPTSKAVTCVRSCQQFTETWQHASQ